MNKTLRFIKKEFIELLPPTIYFFVVISVLSIIRMLMSKNYGIKLTSSAGVLIGSLIIGKSILIADKLPFVRMFSDKRLIYNILWKNFLYSLVVLILLILEELIPLIFKYDSISTAFGNLYDEIHWDRFLASHILLVFFLVIYNVAIGISSAIGHKKSLEILLSPRSTRLNGND